MNQGRKVFPQVMELVFQISNSRFQIPDFKLQSSLLKPIIPLFLATL
jgi:hypothetical protein